jgi:hypothetical protein
LPSRNFRENAGLLLTRLSILLMTLVLTVLESIGILLLIVVSLGGFAAAVTWALVLLAGKYS